MSKLKAVELYNVMSIKEARAEFDETGIISLVGYNDSGKSAFTRAMEIVLYDEYKNEQSKYILKGEDMMGIGLEFDDGVAINKYKYLDGKSVWEFMKDGKMIYTNRLPDGIAAMPTVPQPIAEYLGVIEDNITGEKLNVRRNTDRLLLINTTGGENYKIINAILKLNVLSDAIEHINTEANRIQTDLTVKATTMNNLKDQLEEINFVPTEVIKKLELEKSDIIPKLQRQTKLKEIDKTIQELEGIQVYQELTLIDFIRIEQLNQIDQLLQTLHQPIQPEATIIAESLLQRLASLKEIDKLVEAVNVPIQPEVQQVDITRLALLKEIDKLNQDLAVSIQPETIKIDLSKLSNLENILTLANQLKEEEQSLTKIDDELAEVSQSLEKAAKEQDFRICPNCKTIILGEEHGHAS